jgi:hypothetical protein
MIGNGIDVFYYCQPVESADQAVSLAQYLNSHGQLAYKDGEDQVIAPLECPRKEDAADKSALMHTLVSTWRLFWEHSDQGVFDLPIYQKD